MVMKTHPQGTLLASFSGDGPIAWSPDGTRIALRGEDSTLWVRHATTGKHLFSYRGHQGGSWVKAIDWSPDGKQIASGNIDSVVHIWEAKRVSQFQYALGMQKARRYGTARTGIGTGIKALAWSPDGRYIASGNAEVLVWEVATGKTRCTFEVLGGDLLDIAWLPGQKVIVAANEFYGKLIDAASGKSLSSWQPIGRTQSIALSSNGQYIATAENNRFDERWLVVIRDVASGHPISVFEGHTNYVRTVTWSPDAKFLASGSNDTTVRIWEVKKEETVFIYRQHSDWTNSVVWSPDGSRIASVESGMLGFPLPGKNSVHIWQAI